MGMCIGSSFKMSYSHFNEFRQALAKAEGIDLDETYRTAVWSETALRPLLDHSDCGGFISFGDCEEMIPRLHEIHDEWARCAGDDVEWLTANLYELITEFMKAVEQHFAVEIW